MPTKISFIAKSNTSLITSTACVATPSIHHFYFTPFHLIPSHSISFHLIPSHSISGFPTIGFCFQIEWREHQL